MSFLEVRGLASGYRAGKVLQDLDFDLEEGTAVAVLGRNGVGKTTFLHTLMGLVPPSSGSVRLRDQELARRRPDAIARAGVALVPQGRRVFAPLTVDEHLALAARCGRQRPGGSSWTLERVQALMPRLAERAQHRGDELSGGEQQMLALARAVLMRPVLLLLDEPSEGLAPAVVDQLVEILKDLSAEGVSMILVEQDLHLAFAVAGEVAVMEKGTFVYRSATRAFRRDPATARRLLGV